MEWAFGHRKWRCMPFGSEVLFGVVVMSSRQVLDGIRYPPGNHILSQRFDPAVSPWCRIFLDKGIPQRYWKRN